MAPSIHSGAESPPDEDLSNKELEIVPIEHAELHNLSPNLLRPEGLPELWQDDSASITVGAIREFFGGDDVPQLASDEILFGTIKGAVEAGFLMARRQDKAYFKETISDTELSDDLELFRPLDSISGAELSQTTLPEVWEGETSSVSKVMDALATSKGIPIPWGLIVDAVNDGLSNNLFEITQGSPVQPWIADDADKIGLQVSQAPVTIDFTDFTEVMKQPFDESGQPTLKWIKERLESKKGVSIPMMCFATPSKKQLIRKLLLW